MKKLFLVIVLALVLVLEAGAQIAKTGWTSTSDRTAAAAALMHWPSNGLSTGLVFVDAVTGSDTTGTGSPTAPYATLGFAETNATSGQTIVGVRGTFAESNLGGKTGVDWFFNRGVILTGNPTFALTNNGQSFNLAGNADQIGGALINLQASNIAVTASARFLSNCYAFNAPYGGSWNRVVFSAESATNSPNGIINLAANSSSNEQFRAYLKFSGEMQANILSTASDTAQARTNRVIHIEAHPWRLYSTLQQNNAKCTLVVSGGFERDAKTWTINTANQVVAWRGAYVNTTNSLPGNSIANQIGTNSLLILNP